MGVLERFYRGLLAFGPKGAFLIGGDLGPAINDNGPAAPAAPADRDPFAEFDEIAAEAAVA